MKKLVDRKFIFEISEICQKNIKSQTKLQMAKIKSLHSKNLHL